MRKGKIISSLFFILGIMMISIGMVFQQEQGLKSKKNMNTEQFDLKNIAASANMIVVKSSETKAENNNLLLTEIKMETAPAAVSRVEVFEGMTIEEIAVQLDKSLKNDISGKGMVIANKCIELGVNPYVATAIILHETGCGQNQCSNIARNCYNFGGQKGAGCGAYKKYNSVDEGLEGMISNLYRNYYSRGLVTVETIGPKYAESDTWISKINWYVNKIRNA